jgi:UDP-N-acetyl-D-mannosaminuronate dehydrogenase
MPSLLPLNKHLAPTIEVAEYARVIGMNDSMGPYVASEVVKFMIKKSIPVKRAKALLLGITFKENCLPTVAFAKEGPDIRNTKAIDIYHELKDYGLEVDVYDPCLPRIFGGLVPKK